MACAEHFFHAVAQALFEHEVDPALQLLQDAFGQAALEQVPFGLGPVVDGARFQRGVDASCADRRAGRGPALAPALVAEYFRQYRDAVVERVVLGHGQEATKWVRG